MSVHRGSHVTITHNALDLTARALPPTPDMGSNLYETHMAGKRVVRILQECGLVVGCFFISLVSYVLFFFEKIRLAGKISETFAVQIQMLSSEEPWCSNISFNINTFSLLSYWKICLCKQLGNAMHLKYCCFQHLISRELSVNIMTEDEYSWYRSAALSCDRRAQMSKSWKRQGFKLADVMSN